MKKLLTIALALVLCVSLATPVFAVETITNLTPPNNITSIGINGTANITGGAIVYSINVDWGEMLFTYTANEGTWNPATLTYDGTSETGWAVSATEGAGIATVENRSNAPIRATLVATMSGPYTIITPAVSNGTELEKLGATFDAAGTVDLQSADNALGADGVRAATFASFVVSLSGKPGSDLATNTSIGSVRVTITAGA